jgi:hypothetical protein
MPKYKEYVQRMLDSNKELFEKFSELHNKYSLDEDSHQEEFNKLGGKVVVVVKEWEDKLCRQSEKAGYSSYTTGLAEKFQGEVKKHFPLIDHVGIIVKVFSIKKITLNP